MRAHELLTLARIDKDSTVRLIDRLKASRDQYRDLAVRAEAALLGVPVRGDYGSIERRLERELRDKGFEMPAASDSGRPAHRRRAGSRRGEAGSRCVRLLPGRSP